VALPGFFFFERVTTMAKYFSLGGYSAGNGLMLQKTKKYTGKNSTAEVGELWNIFVQLGLFYALLVAETV
jgi:hypothetical protein